MKRIILAGLLALGVGITLTQTAGATDTNQVSHWCPNGGIKVEDPGSPYTVPAPPEGYTWTKLVIKAGSTGNSVQNENFVVNNPVVGQSYSHPEKDSISHIILCKELTSTTTSSTTTTSTVPTTDSTTTTTTTVPDSTTSSSTTSLTPSDSSTSTTAVTPTSEASSTTVETGQPPVPQPRVPVTPITLPETA